MSTTTPEHATQFCDCGDLLYVHDSTVFAAAPSGSAARSAKAAYAAAPITAGATGGAHWYCKRCGFTKPMTGPTVVHETRKPGGGSSNTNALAMISKYTVMDPTLPHELMFCPNVSCPSHPGAAAADTGAARLGADAADVVIVRTNYQRQEYAFVCTECQHKWMSNK